MRGRREHQGLGWACVEGLTGEYSPGQGTTKPPQQAEPGVALHSALLLPESGSHSKPHGGAKMQPFREVRENWTLVSCPLWLLSQRPAGLLRLSS